MNPWNLTDVPPTTQSVISFMEKVWEGTCRPSPDGGVIVQVSPLYDQFHNARDVARGLGFRQVAPTCLNGEQAYIYAHANGSRLRITRTGGAIAPGAPKRRDMGAMG